MKPILYKRDTTKNIIFGFKITKVFFTAFYVFMCTLSFGQISDKANKIRVSDTFWVEPGSIYVDTTKVFQDKFFIKPSNIKKISIIKEEKEKYIHGDKLGAIVIKRKKEKTLMSFYEIFKNKISADLISDKVFIVNGIFVEDTTDYKFENDIFKSISVIEPGKLPTTDINNKTICVIVTKDYKEDTHFDIK